MHANPSGETTQPTNRYTAPIPALHSMWGISQPTQPYIPQLQQRCSNISKLRQSLQYVDEPLSILPPSIPQSHATDINKAYHVQYSINQSCSLANLNPRGISVILLLRGNSRNLATTQATSAIFNSFMQFGSTI